MKYVYFISFSFQEIGSFRALFGNHFFSLDREISTQEDLEVVRNKITSSLTDVIVGSVVILDFKLLRTER